MKRKQLITRFHLLLLGVLLAITATAYVKVPADVGLPVHWGFNGRPDQFWPRDPALLIFPVTGLLLVALFAAIGQFAAVERIEPGRPVTETLLAGLLGLLCALQFSLVLIGVGSEIDMIRVLSFGVAVLLVAFGIALPRAQPNVHIGIRLPWPTGSAAAWSASHRLTGALLILGGIALGVVAALWPAPLNLLIVMAAAIFAPLLLGFIFSAVVGRGGTGHR
jgi:uncharacterized membrane protein